MAADEDKILFLRVKQGEKPAFDILFNKFYVRLCRFAISYTKSRELAEETVQNMFIKLWCQRESLEINTSVISYLYTAVRNQALNELKKTLIRKNYESEFVSQAGTMSENSVIINEKNFKVSLGKAIEQLPEKCREVFILCKNEGLTYDEIAEYLKISPKTVDNQMGIALKKLRELLKPVFEQLLE